MTVTLDRRGDFTLESFRRVAWAGEAVAIAPVAEQRMAERRAAFMAFLAQDPPPIVYSVTSGFGDAAGKQLDAAGRRQQAERPPYHHGIDMGPPLPARIVRGILFARLTTLLEGEAAVRPVIARRVAELLDGRPLPTLGREALMASGEVDQLVALLHPLLGPGLEEKEGGALQNGCPAAGALAADTALRAARRRWLAAQVLALSVEAARAPLDPFDPVHAELLPDPAEGAALAAVGRCLAGAATEGRRSYQAPVSWRIVPRILAQAWRAGAQLAEAATFALQSIGDNPVFLPPTPGHPLGRTLATGGYHNATLAPATDAVGFAWVDIATLASRHVDKLMLAEFNGHSLGLAAPGQVTGVRRLTHAYAWFRQRMSEAARPTLLPMDDGGVFQSDLFLPSFLAWEREEALARDLDACLAILGVVASQALWLDGRGPAPPLAPLLDSLRAAVPPVESPRDLGAEIGVLRDRFTAWCEGEDAALPLEPPR